MVMWLPRRLLRPKKHRLRLVRFYATTLLFTLAGIVFVIVAIAGVVVLPLMLKFVGLATTTERLLAIVRWPILFVTIVVSLASIYRYGPSRRDTASTNHEPSPMLLTTEAEHDLWLNGTPSCRFAVSEQPALF